MLQGCLYPGSRAQWEGHVEGKEAKIFLGRNNHNGEKLTVPWIGSRKSRKAGLRLTPNPELRKDAMVQGGRGSDLGVRIVWQQKRLKENSLLICHVRCREGAGLH